MVAPVAILGIQDSGMPFADHMGVGNGWDNGHNGFDNGRMPIMGGGMPLGGGNGLTPALIPDSELLLMADMV